MIAGLLCKIFGHEWARSDVRTITMTPVFKAHARANICNYCGKRFKRKRSA